MKCLFKQLCIIIFVLSTTQNIRAAELQEVSIIDLIANPKLYNGEQIRLIGFLRLEFEGNAVYLHREDFQYSIAKNSIALTLTDAQESGWMKLNNHYVLIEGRFNSSENGHLGMHSGSVEMVSRISKWSSRRK